MDGNLWLPDERDPAGDEHLDPEFVAGYDRKQGSVAAEAAEQDLEILRSHGIDERATVVDLGAGTGRFRFKAAAVVAHVVAGDISPAMVEALRRRAIEHHYDNVQIVQAGWLTYRHEGTPVDAIHSRNALHQLPDTWKVVALHRVAQMLRLGGVLRLRTSSMTARRAISRRRLSDGSTGPFPTRLPATPVTISSSTFAPSTAPSVGS